MWRTVADSAAPQRHFGIRSPVEAVKFHPEFRLTLIQCKAKFEWNLDRAHSWAIAKELSWNYPGTTSELYRN